MGTHKCSILLLYLFLIFHSKKTNTNQLSDPTFCGIHLHTAKCPLVMLTVHHFNCVQHKYFFPNGYSLLTAPIHCLMREYAQIALASPPVLASQVRPGQHSPGLKKTTFRKSKRPCILKCKLSGGSSSLRKTA